jgi:hypothetical protein
MLDKTEELDVYLYCSNYNVAQALWPRVHKMEQRFGKTCDLFREKHKTTHGHHHEKANSGYSTTREEYTFLGKGKGE